MREDSTIYVGKFNPRVEEIRWRRRRRSTTDRRPSTDAHLARLIGVIGEFSDHRLIGQRNLARRRGFIVPLKRTIGSRRWARREDTVLYKTMLMSADDRLKIKDRCDHICAMLYKFR